MTASSRQQEVKEDNEEATEVETENKKLKKEQQSKERIRKRIKKKQRAQTQKVLKRVNSTPYITNVEVIDSYEGQLYNSQ